VRVSAETKRKTRERLLRVAGKLFAKKGFAAASTRDIAAAADVAPGTLFNYFATKDALALALIDEALKEGRQAFHARRRKGAGLDEELFDHALTALHALEPFRGYVAEVFQSALSPFAPREESREADEIKREHLEVVAQLLGEHGVGARDSLVALQLYWTLHLGVIAAWTRDTSKSQDDTLALLDHTVRVFVASLDAKTRKEQ
jgi:AcrR family transcriptional regulator